MPAFNLDDYVPVQERIVQFWKDYPDGRIITRLVSDPSQFEAVIVQAEVYKHRDHPVPDASDLASEEKGQGGQANRTSWLENASTSAIGRALANLGYATSQKNRPSREEMSKVDRGTDTERTLHNAPQARQDRSGATKEAHATPSTYEAADNPLVNPKQVKALETLAARRNVPWSAVTSRSMEKYGSSVHAIKFRQFLELQDWVSNYKPGMEEPISDPKEPQP